MTARRNDVGLADHIMLGCGGMLLAFAFVAGPTLIAMLIRRVS